MSLQIFSSVHPSFTCRLHAAIPVKKQVLTLFSRKEASDADFCPRQQRESLRKSAQIDRSEVDALPSVGAQLSHVQQSGVELCAILPPELWALIFDHLPLQDMYRARGVSRPAHDIINSLLPVAPRSHLFKDQADINCFLATYDAKDSGRAIRALYYLVHSKQAQCGYIPDIKKILALPDKNRELNVLIEACSFEEKQIETLKNTAWSVAQLHYIKSSNFILERVRGAELNLDHFLKIPDEYLKFKVFDILWIGQRQVMVDMVASGFFLNMRDSFGLAPIHHCAIEGNTRLLKELLGYAPNVHITDYQGRTALHYAAKKKNADMVACLLEHGASAQSIDAAECTPLLYAIKNHCKENARILIPKMAQCDDIDLIGMSALHYAVRYHDLDICLALLEKNASVKIPNAQGHTALHYAVIRKFSASFKLLVEAGADVHQVGNNKYTAYVNQKDARGLTALHHAAERGSIEAVLFLIEHGGNLHARDHYGRTPLHCAAMKGHVQLISLLSSVDLCDLACHAGKTALHYAALSGNSHTVRMLLRIGVSLPLRDKKGRNAFEYALRTLHFKSAQVLLAAYMQSLAKRSFFHTLRSIR